MRYPSSYTPPARPAADPRFYTAQPGVMPGHSPYYPGVLHARSRPRIPWGWLTTAAILLLLAVVLVILTLANYVWYTATDRVFPGVKVGGLEAGDLTRAELSQKIDAQWNRQPALRLTDGKHTWRARPIDLGLWVNPQATADSAYQIGRGPSGLAEMAWLIRFNQQPVEPSLVFSEPAARKGLEKLASQINQPARDATFQQVNGQWTAVPGQNGSQLIIDATLKGIAANPKAIMTTGMIPLVMQPVAPQVSDLSPALNQLRAALSHPLKMQAFDPFTNQMTDWEIQPAELAGWVTAQPNGADFSVQMDGQALVAYLENWKASLGPDKTLEPFTPPADLTERWQSGQPVTTIIHYNPTTYTVVAGDTLTRIAFKVGMPYWKIQKANPNIDSNHLSAGQTLTIPSKNEMLPLPIVINKRIVVSISQQHMWTYENGAQRSEHVISTGIERSPTIPGVYQIRTHEVDAYAAVWDLRMPHFMGIYEGWPGFMNGIHGLPTLSNGTLLWKGYLGRPISYGCIVMSLPEAEDVFNWAEEGVIVEIQP